MLVQGQLNRSRFVVGPRSTQLLGRISGLFFWGKLDAQNAATRYRSLAIRNDEHNLRIPFTGSLYHAIH